jgi:hypothetical protein
MAGNTSSGNVLVFRMTEEQLGKAIEQYKIDLDNGKFQRASWPHFCARLGYTEQEVQDVIKRGDEVKGAYFERAQMLKRMLTWIRGEMLSGAGWGGQSQTKAIFALQQDYGDGLQYVNNRGTAAGGGAIRVELGFGGGDPRGKKAGK